MVIKLEGENGYRLMAELWDEFDIPGVQRVSFVKRGNEVWENSHGNHPTPITPSDAEVMVRDMPKQHFMVIWTLDDYTEVQYYWAEEPVDFLELSDAISAFIAGGQR